jgi:SLOG in TRPM, prokaryote/Protein of unknown function (DUF4231)
MHIVRATRTTPASQVVQELELPPVHGVVVLNGGTIELDAERGDRLRALLGDGLAAVVAQDRLTVLTGGTQAGVFALFGAALGDDSTVASVGVAPEARVTWPGRVDAGDDAVPLEQHHSRFVLVDGDEWGDETGMMLRLAAALAADVPSLAVLAGGGNVAKRELLGHVRAGRDVVALAGSGRLADDVAAAIAGSSSHDPEVREAAASGRVIVFDAAGRPDELRALVHERLTRGRSRRPTTPALLRRFPMPRYRKTPDSPLVPAPLRADLPLLEDELAYLDTTLVPRFRELDHAALRAQHAYRLASVALIIGSATATSLGAAQAATGGGTLGIGVAEAVVAAAVSGIVVYARGRRFQRTYLAKRLAAERVKSQYFRFIAHAGVYADSDDDRRVHLARAIERIDAGEEPE